MECHLEKLCQTRPCAHYAAQFRKYIGYLTLSEHLWVTYFYWGLKEELKDALVYAASQILLTSPGMLCVSTQDPPASNLGPPKPVADSPDIPLSSPSNLPDFTSKVLQKYYKYLSIFSPTEVNRLPPHHPYNMKINLKDSKELSQAILNQSIGTITFAQIIQQRVLMPR
ncbi:hypothetical protein FRB99_000567, partial [Tulasnella sp. 403]